MFVHKLRFINVDGKIRLQMKMASFHTDPSGEFDTFVTDDCWHDVPTLVPEVLEE